MIKVTKNAATQIKKIAAESGAEDLMLRIAVGVEEDGSLEYGMGFDEPRENDQRLNMEGVEVIVADNCSDILDEAVLDFVEIEEGDFDFIFFNPNDPNHKQPKS